MSFRLFFLGGVFFVIISMGRKWLYKVVRGELLSEINGLKGFVVYRGISS